jgi:cell cycle sensor histidine kinase DivJ
VAGIAACLVAYFGAAAEGGQLGVASTLLMCGALAYAASLVCAGERIHAMRLALSDVSRARYDSLTRVVGDLVLHIDRSGAVVQSLGGADLLGLAARELVGRGLFERIHVADRPAFLKAVSDAASGERIVSAQVRVRGEGACEASGFGWVDLRARRVEAAMAGRDGRALEYVTAVLRDVTALRDHAAQMEEAQRETQRMGEWQDRFLANVSHELRTPLNAIIGFSEILASETLAPAEPAKRAEYAGIINQSGQHLLAVVNSILDISKIEAGSFNLLPEAFELRPLVDQVCDIVRLKAQETDVDVSRDVPAHLGELVADKRALKQILINLVSNAVKFTPSGGRVLIRVRPEGASLAIAISDTGIGIVQADLGRLGDPFFQAGANYDRPYEGTGLGLSVVRGLVGLHGGAITLESAPGEGTCVTVKLPLDCRVLPESAKTALARITTLPRGPVRKIATFDDKVKKIA